ncbi:MAG: hypothetical protein UX09_C0010G0005 [Candidatus Uhrbacteria bacterium GW2011_GWE2_45_35]|uniref:PrgI family protein n=2 Tax=Candidatus Uhriibacteriota TaxID=1752732 RepID=A0A0G1JAQ9_9BACT|nr:MAG: hypothetical protein UW63_C0079G0005 [Candidatus Uhrbacteria bacterium GW2011_GWF2_44_350]KKU08851.1 MAG: hypothetical protein UX09_C0010G0005 [Candidatus Uhrbacteria bacterium GW2011_GWE2_45_35]HBR80658.1 hypothetical protein [Candidatus Uhrbacteria bacterium]HCU31860.1 hypothetical protein [Candidatus Uhrbacteria bacterium]
MSDQFTVPQFIEVEDKILGPLSVRQFLILLSGAIVLVALYKMLRMVPFLIIGVPFLSVMVIFAFAKINGMPFHFFLLNLVQTLRKPRLRVWDKKLFNSELKQYMVAPPPPPPAPAQRKPPPSGSHLQELTLLVNTGGAYKPED